MIRRHLVTLLVALVPAAGCLPSDPDNHPVDTGVGATAVVNEYELVGDLAGMQIFPEDNWWNLDVSQAPLDISGDEFIYWIGCDTQMHPDFGPSPYGMPYMVVPGDQPRVPVTWTEYGFQSDDGAPGEPPGYPIPYQAIFYINHIEGGAAGGGAEGDRHMLIVDPDNGLLFETWHTLYNFDLGRWEAGSGAIFDLNSNKRRPEGWTSADAAGLAIFPGLVRYDEVFGPDEIDHAFRVTFTHSNDYVWPASHRGGSEPGAWPLGTRLRLRADFDESGYAPYIQKIFRAMKKYGLIFADNGSDLYVQGTMDSRWDSSVLNPAFHSVTADDFEVIKRGWNPFLHPSSTRNDEVEVAPEGDGR